MMWFLQGLCGHSLGPVPASCGFFTPTESLPGPVLFPRAWAGSPDGTVLGPWRPPSLSLLGGWGRSPCFVEKQTRLQRGTAARQGHTAKELHREPQLLAPPLPCLLKVIPGISSKQKT